MNTIVNNHTTSTDSLAKMYPDYQFLKSLTVGLTNVESFWCFHIENQRHRLLKIYHCPVDWGEVVPAELEILEKVRTLSHPNLVNVHDCWVVQNQIYVIEDYIEAPTVRTILGEGRLGLHTLLNVTIQLCEATKKLHLAGLYHGSISPNHVFVSNEFLKLSAPSIEEFIRSQTPATNLEAPFFHQSPDLTGQKKDMFSIASLMFFFSTGYTPSAIDPSVWREYGVSEHIESIIKNLLEPDSSNAYTAEKLEEKLTELRERLYPEDYPKENFITKLFKLSLTRKVTVKHIAPSGFNCTPTNFNDQLNVHEYAPGELLAERFKIDCLVEREDFDVVYKALDTKLNDREVLLHYLPKGIDLNWKQRFEQICSQLAKVNHPHISQLIDASSFEDGAFFATQLEDGDTLQTFARRHSFTYPEVLEFSHQILDALRVANEYDFHCPTMTMNTISVYRHSTKGYFYRMTSLGHGHLLALVHGEDRGRELTFTPETLAPESYEGSAQGQLTSQFILGNIIYEMLVESHACKNMSLIQAYNHQLKGIFTEVGSVREDVPTYFLQWLNQLKAPDPNERFATLAQAFEFLQKCPAS